MSDVLLRTKIIQKIGELLFRYPTLRFGQIIVKSLGKDPFYIPDEEVLEALEHLRKRLNQQDQMTS
jgi:hypothetical protein